MARTRSNAASKPEKAKQSRSQSSSPSPSRSKSPARPKEKSPARRKDKSPAKPKKTTKKTNENRDPSPSRSRSKSPARSRSKSPSRSASKSPSRDQKKDDEVIRKVKVDADRMIKEARNILSNSGSNQTITRREVRSETIERSSRAMASNNRREYSDEESDEPAIKSHPKRSSRLTSLAKQIFRHFWKIFQVVCLISFLNGFVLYVHVNCGPVNCKLSRVPSFPGNIAAYWDINALPLLVLFFVVEALLSKLPAPSLGSKRKIRLAPNGFWCLLLTVLAAIGVFYSGHFDFIRYDPSKQLKFAVGASKLAFLVSMFMYLKLLVSKKRRGHPLDDFFIGSNAGTSFAGIDLKKLISFRIGHFVAVIVYISYLEANYSKNKGSLSPALVLAAAMQIIYCCIVQFLEEDLSTSFLIKEDGLSYARIFHHLVITPFVMTLPGRFLLENLEQAKMPQLCMAGCLIPFVFGAVLFYGSNHLKGVFKRDPDSLSHVICISDGRGYDRQVRLISSGLFRYVRHPNYAGDLLIHLSIASLTGFSSLITYVPFFYLLLLSLCRIWRIEKNIEARSRAGASALEEYRRQVPSRLVPKVF